mmetsp:Transcript_15015/g.32258  ORF Transcript_15015/g.32258 Transcript_15015/m.32258 type:complete len:419 (-) Transcript_15015:61-1317(-)
MSKLRSAPPPGEGPKSVPRVCLAPPPPVPSPLPRSTPAPLCSPPDPAASSEGSGRLILAGADVVGEGDEGGRSLRVVHGQLRLGVLDQLEADALGLLEAEEGGVGGLADGVVFARRLAELLASLRAVQDVVDHLERQPDVLRVPRQPLHVLLRRAAEKGAGDDGGVEEGRGLVGVDVLQRLEGGLLVGALHLDVHDLPAHQALRPHALRHVRHHAQHHLRVHLVEGGGHGDVLEGAGEEAVPGEDGALLAVHLVVGGLAPAEVVVVHAGQVVVHQRHGVDHLQRARGGHGHGGVLCEHFARGDAQGRADALATRQQRVPHRLVDGVGVLLSNGLVERLLCDDGLRLHVLVEVELGLDGGLSGHNAERLGLHLRGAALEAKGIGLARGDSPSAGGGTLATHASGDGHRGHCVCDRRHLP